MGCLQIQAKAPEVSEAGLSGDRHCFICQLSLQTPLLGLLILLEGQVLQMPPREICGIKLGVISKRWHGCSAQSVSTYSSLSLCLWKMAVEFTGGISQSKPKGPYGL